MSVLVVIDLEATCCNHGTVLRHEMEIIEIGAVAVAEDGLVEQEEFARFVCPVRHPRLTDFCRELTTISQTQVDAADSYPAVMAEFTDWLQQWPEFTFCSWGDYDRTQFHQDCDFHGIPWPLGEHHRNLKREFAEWVGTGRRFGLGGALRHLGLEFEGTQHRGIDDARNIVRVLRAMG